MKVLLRLSVIAAVALSAACSPSAVTPTEAPAAPAADASTQAVAALTPVISAEIGKDVALQTTTVNTQDGWAYVVARPQNPDGSAIDWSTTNLASRYENGAMDESGSIYALLQEQNGAWAVVEHVIAPTDVAWLDWAARHSVPAGVVDVPTAPAP